MVKVLKLGVLLNVINTYRDEFEDIYLDNILDICLSISPDILENEKIQEEIIKIDFEEQKLIACDCLIELDSQLNKIGAEDFEDIITINKNFFRKLFNELNTFNQNCIQDKHGIAILNYFEHLSVIDKFNFSLKSVFKKHNIKCPFNE